MRILVITQWYPPEPVSLLSELAETLRDLGHDVTVLTGFPNWPSGHLYEGYRVKPWQIERINGIKVVRAPLYPYHGRRAIGRLVNFLSFMVCAPLTGLLFVRRPDIIESTRPPTVSWVAYFLSRIWRVPFTHEIQDMWPETLSATGMVSSSRILKAVGKCCNWSYGKAALIRVITPGFRRSLIEKGVKPEKIVEISNWVDTAEYKPIPRSDEFAAQHGLQNAFNVMYAGNLGLAQGLMTIIDVAEKLKDTAGLRFVFVGDGADSERLKSEAARRELTNVLFIGRVPGEQMNDMYACADTLLVHLKDDPLFRMTIPHKVFTCMAAGKPVLAAVGGDTDDLLNRYKAGVACLPGDADSIAKGVLKLFNMSESERRVLGESGRRAMCSDFTREKLVGEIAKMLQDCLDARKR